MRLSGQDLAARIGCSAAAVSIAKREGRHVHGQWPVSAWAVHDADGRLEYYDVPDDCPLVADEDPPSRKEAEAAPPSDLEEAASGILTEEQIREIIRSEIPRENPAEPQQDYMRPVAAGGLSYVMAEAVKGDSGTARAAVLCAASLLGGLIGHETSDHWAGALAGAALVGGLGWQAMRSVAAAADAGSGADAPAAHAGMATEESGKDFHIPDAHADTHQQPIRAVGT